MAINDLIEALEDSKADLKTAYKALDPQMQRIARVVHDENVKGIDRAIAKLKGETPDENRTITITVKGGMVQDVTGLPDGWDYEIDDQDGE